MIYGEEDHVHLLVEHGPSLQLSLLANRLKGKLSCKLRDHRFWEVSSELWGRHLRSPSYFAASNGGAPISVVRQYIENQDAPRGNITRLPFSTSASPSAVDRWLSRDRGVGDRRQALPLLSAWCNELI